MTKAGLEKWVKDHNINSVYFRGGWLYLLGHGLVHTHKNRQKKSHSYACWVFSDSRNECGSCRAKIPARLANNIQLFEGMRQL